jgi:hypothetical protein
LTPTQLVESLSHLTVVFFVVVFYKINSTSPVTHCSPQTSFLQRFGLLHTCASVSCWLVPWGSHTIFPCQVPINNNSQQQLPFIEYLPSARNFATINLSHILHQNSIKWVLLISFLKWKKPQDRKISNLPMVIASNCQTLIWTLASLLAEFKAWFLAPLS